MEQYESSRAHGDVMHTGGLKPPTTSRAAAAVFSAARPRSPAVSLPLLPLPLSLPPLRPSSFVSPADLVGDGGGGSGTAVPQLVLVGDRSAPPTTSPSPSTLRSPTTMATGAAHDPCVSDQPRTSIAHDPEHDQSSVSTNSNSEDRMVPVTRSLKRRLYRSTRERHSQLKQHKTGGCAAEGGEGRPGNAHAAVKGSGVDRDGVLRRGTNWTVLDGTSDHVETSVDKSGDSGTEWTVPDGTSDCGETSVGESGESDASDGESGEESSEESKQGGAPAVNPIDVLDELGGPSTSASSDGSCGGERMRQYGEMKISVRRKTTQLTVRRMPSRPRWATKTAPWVTMDGVADAKGDHGFPVGATDEQKRRWRNAMAVVQKAMQNLLSSARLASTTGLAHPQTLAMHPDAKRGWSEAHGAKFVYVYAHVQGECKACRDKVYVGKLCNMSATEVGFRERDMGHHQSTNHCHPPLFDKHYREHPLKFWRTVVYSYEGPNGELPTRMAVSRVEHDLWAVFAEEGRALNANAPTHTVRPVTPIVGDNAKWSELHAVFMMFKADRGDMLIPDAGALGRMAQIVRLQRGLGDAAEEEMLTQAGFDWAADRRSRAERNLHSFQCPLVRDMLSWAKDKGSFPMYRNRHVRGGSGTPEQRKEHCLRDRWGNMLRQKGGVSLVHAKRLNRAFLYGRQRHISRE